MLQRMRSGYTYNATQTYSPYRLHTDMLSYQEPTQEKTQKERVPQAHLEGKAPLLHLRTLLFGTFFLVALELSSCSQLPGSQHTWSAVRVTPERRV